MRLRVVGEQEFRLRAAGDALDRSSRVFCLLALRKCLECEQPGSNTTHLRRHCGLRPSAASHDVHAGVVTALALPPLQAEARAAAAQHRSCRCRGSQDGICGICDARVCADAAVHARCGRRPAGVGGRRGRGTSGGDPRLRGISKRTAVQARGQAEMMRRPAGGGWEGRSGRGHHIDCRPAGITSRLARCSPLDACSRSCVCKAPAGSGPDGRGCTGRRARTMLRHQ